MSSLKSNRKIVKYKPQAVDVEKGKTYYWCSCGLSKNQPWYDEATCSDKCEKVKFVAEKEELHMCMCKQTNNPSGFCDGTHRKLKKEEKSNNSNNLKPNRKIVKYKPQAVDVEKGKTYYWCSCGLSKNQPWYDEATCSDKCEKVKFVAEKEELHMCMCKQTNNPSGFCDGTHRKLKKEERKVPDLEDLGKPTNTNDDDDEPTIEEPTLAYVKLLARKGAKGIGHHGPVDAMGVPGPTLPQWKDIQILVAQLATKPLPDDASIDTTLVIGPRAKKPLVLKIPLFVSDMSFGALSREAKIALSKGAQLAGTGICSGEGGMLPAEQENNSRYFYELASAKFGWDWSICKKVQAFHFKGGQGAKTGTGGHLPGDKVTEEIAAVRKLPVGQSAISPPTFTDLVTAADFKAFADKVREESGGIPIGFKLSANHIEADIDFALEASADYIILDGRGGATGAAPLIFRDNISVPTIPALARARRHLDKRGANDITLIITGGLRTPDDFIKAMCLGADGVAIANSAIQSVGCVAARMCNTNQCPAGIATQDPKLRAKLDVNKGARQLKNFFEASASLMSVMARACGHHKTSEFCYDDIGTWKKDMAELSGVRFQGVGLNN